MDTAVQWDRHVRRSIKKSGFDSGLKAGIDSHVLSSVCLFVCLSVANYNYLARANAYNSPASYSNGESIAKQDEDYLFDTRPSVSLVYTCTKRLSHSPVGRDHVVLVDETNQLIA